MMRSLTSRPLNLSLRAVLWTSLALTAQSSALAQPTEKTLLVSQPSVSDEVTRDQQLIDAERAILEGLSARAVGAFDGNVPPAKAPRAPAKPEPEKKTAPAAAVVAAAPSEPITVEKPILPAPKPAEVKAKTAEQVPPTQPNTHVNASKIAHENERLKRELGAKTERVVALERELELVRGQLSSAEIELSRISSIKDPSTRASLKRYPAPPAQSAPAKNMAAEPASATRSDPVAVTEPLPSADLQIATVSGAKVDLRLGPGKEHSALMQVGKGTRLAVEARKGEWYRVFAPNGQRAWVSASQVTFGGTNAESSSTVRVRGYSRSLEDAAFQRIQSMTAEK